MIILYPSVFSELKKNDFRFLISIDFLRCTLLKQY